MRSGFQILRARLIPASLEPLCLRFYPRCTFEISRTLQLYFRPTTRLGELDHMVSHLAVVSTGDELVALVDKCWSLIVTRFIECLTFLHISRRDVVRDGITVMARRRRDISYLDAI